MKKFEEFQQFRQILCICPCCSEIVRVSDLKIKTKKIGEKTFLDDFENKSKLISVKENKFEEIKAKLREDAVNKGRIEAQKVFNKAINPQFAKLKFNPYDLKPILNPIDFLVFKDMNEKKQVNEVIFLSKIVNNPMINKIREQIKVCVKEEKYDWNVARIDEKGGILLEN